MLRAVLYFCLLFILVAICGLLQPKPSGLNLGFETPVFAQEGDQSGLSGEGLNFIDVAGLRGTSNDPLTLLFSSSARAAEYNMALMPQTSGYTYRRSITIDHTRVPNTDQSNFPVLISGTYSYL